MGTIQRILLGLLGLLAILILAAPFLMKAIFPESELRERILPRASSMLGRSVDCEGMDFGLSRRGISLRLEGLSIGPAPEGAEGEILELPHFEADLALGPLLDGRVELKRLRLDRPRIGLQVPESENGEGKGHRGGEHWAAPAALAFAAPDVHIHEGHLTIRQERGPALEVHFPDLRFRSAVERTGGTQLDVEGEGDG